LKLEVNIEDVERLIKLAEENGDQITADHIAQFDTSIKQYEKDLENDENYKLAQKAFDNAAEKYENAV